MQQITSVNVEGRPKTGYLVSKDKKIEKHYADESHIHKQGPFSEISAGVHKLSNNFATYFPKGFKGSKNSDFYEFLSLGMVPTIIGSAMMIGLYSVSNGKFNSLDKFAANQVAKRMGSGVLLYGIGKWASKKLAHAGIYASTGVNLDMLYLNKITEIPEGKLEKGFERIQYPKVFASVDFYRKDLLAKDSELNHDDIYYHDDKIAKKAGYKNKLNAPNQTMGPKIRELIARTTALENVGKYIVAATGVALGSQKAFGDIKLSLKGLKNAKGSLISIKDALVKGSRQLWEGSEKNVLTKNYGKALIIASGVSTLLNWLIPTIGFKTNPNTMKSKVDTKKEFEVS